MSFDAIKWAMAQPVGRASAKFVLVAMADAVNAETSGQEMVCWPSARHLAQITAQDAKTIQASLRRLREEGYIEPTGQRVGVTGQVIVYRLKTPEIGCVEQHPEGFEDTRFSVETHPKTDELKTTVFPGNTTVFPVEDTRFSVETHPKTGDGTTKEPGKEPGRNQSRAAGGDAMPEGFPEFWATYPKKDAKADAIKAWQQKGLDVSETKRAQVMAGVAAWKRHEQWTKDAGRFIPHPATFLRKERWNDETATKATGAAGRPSAPPEWWKQAGFDTPGDAGNARCYWTNFTEFRDGKRIEVATA